MNPQPISENNETTQFGGFWIRVGAYFIDLVVLIVPTLLVSFLVVSVYATRGQAMIEIIDLISSLIIWWIYFAILHSSKWQASIGKKVVGLKVSDKSGNRISFARATGRYFATILSTVTFCIGYMMVGWTKNKQGLHDMIAETYVIRSENS